MQPIRREQKKDQIHEPFNHRNIDVQEQDAAHAVADDGGLNSAHLLRRHACGCGCVGAPGGICAVCACLCCSSCFSRCRCGKPLCPAHRRLVEAPGGGQVVLCKPCHDAMVRSRRWRTVVGVLLAPFIERGKADGTKRSSP